MANGQITKTETLRLVAMSGDVFYIAKVPENTLPVPFRMETCSDDVATFANPAHDFPKRISYRWAAPDRMTVSVQGEGDQGFTLEFKRLSAGLPD